MIPERATHEHQGIYYRKAGPSAYRWCSTGKRWVYMEDRGAQQALAKARRL